MRTFPLRAVLVTLSVWSLLYTSVLLSFIFTSSSLSSSSSFALAKEILPKYEPAGLVKVNKKLIDSPLEDIQWVTSKLVYVLTERGQLYRSDDGGLSWVNQAGKLASSTSSVEIRSIHVSRADPRKIFFMGRGKDHWVTNDMGKTYSEAGALEISEIRLHPRQSRWLMASTMSSGCNATPKQECYKMLHVSKDFGENWHQVATYVVQFEWYPIGKKPPTPDHNEILNSKYTDPTPTPEDDILYSSLHVQKRGNQKFGSWDKNIWFFSTNDYFKTTKELVKHGNRFLFGENNYIFVAAVNPRRETEVSLQISRDSGVEKTFAPALLPVELTEHSYTILDTSEATVFLHVNHAPFETNAPTGHVYISDATGISYSLSLPFNRRSPDGKCDFEKVDGLEGIYLANFIDETEGENVEKWSDGSTENYGRKNPKVKTVITFDKGGIWSYLDPPQLDANGQKIACTKDCHLHLHGIIDLYGPFYSSKTATGLIMSTGSVGPHLSRNVDEINTYLSRDGGLTWYEVAKGSHIYEFGAHGGLLVMAYDEGAVDSVLYSWDQGVTWRLLKISETPFQIENVIIEPEAVSQKFIVYGWEDSSGVLVYLDFSDLHTRECQGHDAPDSKDSDYETWTPSDGRTGNKCLMGHKISYTRRKRESQCYIPEVHERRVFVENCTCTDADFECDFGYTRKVEGGPCVPDPDAVIPPPPTTCENFQRVTKGYRRIAGDTCVGGEQWDPVLFPCPSVLGHHYGKIIMFILLIVVGALIVGNFYNKVEWMSDLVGRVKGWFGYDGRGGYRSIDDHDHAPSALDGGDEFDLDNDNAHLMHDSERGKL